MEPDYAPHITRAERALQAIYPAMCDRKSAQAVEHALEAIRELTAYVSWIVEKSKK